MKQEFKPKDGDFIVSGWEDKVSECEWISILRGYFSKEYYNQYAGLILIGNNRGKLEYTGYCDAQEYTRSATGSEKQLFIEKLKERGKRWNPETKRIEDILKVGDLAIFWDDDKKDAVVAKLLNINEFSEDLKTSGYDNPSSILDEEGGNLCYKNAIKCESLQHYIDFMNS